jgi:hypothetical protein
VRLYHYYERSRGPFLTISDLPYNEACGILQQIRKIDPRLVNPDIHWFLKRRKELEQKARDLFIQKGGKPVRQNPLYMTVEKADIMNIWYIETECLSIDMSEFDPDTISFTFGDMFPIFDPSCDKGEEYRNRVYTYDEINDLIIKYGYPQQIHHPPGTVCNRILKYAEAHIWSDDIPRKYRKALNF